MVKIIYPLIDKEYDKNNLESVLEIMRSLHTPEVIPVMPELALMDFLDDKDIIRDYSLKVISKMFSKGIYDEIDCSNIGKNQLKTYNSRVVNDAAIYSGVKEIKFSNVQNLDEIARVKPTSLDIIDNNIKLIYPEHMIGSKIQGAAEENLERIRSICRDLCSNDELVIPLYLGMFMYLDDKSVEQRNMGIAADNELLKRGTYDKHILCISYGMAQGILSALHSDTPVYVYNKLHLSQEELIVKEK